MKADEALEAIRETYKDQLTYGRWVVLMSALVANLNTLRGIDNKHEEMGKSLLVMASDVFLSEWADEHSEADQAEIARALDGLVRDSKAMVDVGLSVLAGPDGNKFRS